MEIRNKNGLGVDWSKNRTKFLTDETHNELRQSLDAGVFPYIPKARQQRSGLLVDFLCLRGTSPAADLLDLLMFGENKFGVLLVQMPQNGGSTIDDVAVLKSCLRDQKHASSASAALRALDVFFSENLKTAAGVPAYYAVFNQQQRTINLASAGHAPMVLYRPDEKKLLRLNAEGGALGLAPQAFEDFSGRVKSQLPSLKSETVRVRQHDLLVLYSDGVVEAKNAWGEPFGLNRLLKFISNNGHMQPTPFLIELQNVLEQFTMGEQLEHDVTVVAVKNMLKDPDGVGDENLPEVEDRFLTLDEEKMLWQICDKHPEARISELIDLLGERYVHLGHERIRMYLTNGQRLATNGVVKTAPTKKRFESLEKYFQQQMLQAFPIRQLLYRKYEFRGNTGVIGKALEHYQNGEFQESLIEFIKVRKAIAESESVHCFFGNLYLLLNMSIKARQEYLKALKLNPRSIHAYLALAYISLLHEDYNGTINNLTIAMRLDSNLLNYERFLSQLVQALDKQNGVQEWLA